MEGLDAPTAFATLIGEVLREPFTLVDVGCSGGIGPVWRVFGNSLRAFGFDPNLSEIARLNEQESLPGVTYVPAFVGLPQDDPGRERLRSGDYWARSPWNRLSVVRTLEIKAAAIAKANADEKTRMNQWSQVPLADTEKPVVIQEFMRERGIDDIDFVKIDVDGADFLILRSLEAMLRETRVLGVGIEVNFFGSDHPEIHTFHNVDRFMKRNGFELFALSSRPYATAALPSPFQFAFPGESIGGRPLQGDAIYLRDAAAAEHAEWARSAGPQKLMKLAALFSLVDLPDCAADVLLAYRSLLAPALDIAAGLDMLTAQAIPPGQPVLGYDDYMAAFEADSPRFYSMRQNAAPAAPPAEPDEPAAPADIVVEAEQPSEPTPPRSTVGGFLKRILRTGT